MSATPRLYTAEHVWLLPAADGSSARVGITAHLPEALGQVLLVQLPWLGQQLRRGAAACVIESSKAAFDLLAPADGAITAVNEALHTQPQLLASDPLGAGWIFAMRLTAPQQLGELLEETAYQQYICSGANI